MMDTATKHDEAQTPPDVPSPSGDDGLLCPVCGSAMELLWDIPRLRKHVCDHDEGRIVRFENTESQTPQLLPSLAYPADMTRGNMRVGHLAKPTCQCVLCEKIANW